MTLPERIWAEPAGRYRQMPTWDKDGAAFIRADLVDELVKALERAIDAIEGVQRDTYYEFDGDYTPESDRLVPRLRAALTRIKGDGK